MKVNVTDAVRRGKTGALVQVECESDAEMKTIRAAAKDSGLTVSKWLHHVIMTGVSGMIGKNAKAGGACPDTVTVRLTAHNFDRLAKVAAVLGQSPEQLLNGEVAGLALRVPDGCLDGECWQGCEPQRRKSINSGKR